jgi:hypothetical protein
MINLKFHGTGMVRKVLNGLIIGFSWMCVCAPASSQEAQSLQALELWNFYDNVGNGNTENATQVRYYLPIEASKGDLTLRLDTSAYSQFGASYPNQNIFDYQTGFTKITLYAKGPSSGQWSTAYGLRTLLPIGAANQWLMAPHFGVSFTPKQGPVTDISPLVRYFYGFDPRYPNVTLVRNLNVFPTVGFRLSAKTEARFWDENPAVVNLNNGQWFVPIDVQVIHNIDKRKYFIIGTSQGLIRDYYLYTNSTYVSFGYKF